MTLSVGRAARYGTPRAAADPSGGPALRVAIVDDHPVSRYGIQRILDYEGTLTVVSAAGSVAEMEESGFDADVLVLDPCQADGRMPASQIEALARTAAVLVFSTSVSERDVRAALHAGARGYVTKRSSVSVFVEAVRTVAAGGCFLSVDPPGPPVAPAEDPSLRLAPREREALALIAQGFTQAQAAARMGVSKTTVDTYLRRIRDKLGPGNKADLTRRALALGSIDPAPTGTPSPDHEATVSASRKPIA